MSSESFAGSFKKYVRTFEERAENSHAVQEPTISVSDASSALAFYYEKIRTIIDYQDEHLLRQNAIKRILGRRLIFQDSHEAIALALLKELVRSRYFPNHALPLSRVDDVRGILDVMGGVADRLREQHRLAEHDEQWLIGIASCAIDETLSPMEKEEGLVRLMVETLSTDVRGACVPLDERVRMQQITIAAYRVLLRPDVARLRYFILKHLYPEWTKGSSANIEALCNEYEKHRDAIEAMVKDSLNKKLIPVFRRHRIPFILIHTIIRKQGFAFFADASRLDEEVVRLCENMYGLQRKRLFSRTIRAFVYIFLTKMVLGFAFELPYDLLMLGHINIIPLAINVVIPPLLLLAITMTVRFPGKENTALIVRAIHEIIDPDTSRQSLAQSQYGSCKRSIPLTIFFSVLHSALFIVSFGAIIWALRELHFNIVSGIVFVLFACLITFFGITLRRSVRDFSIQKPRLSIIALFFDSFFLPIIQVGRWLSFNISRINVFIFIFDVLIELPFQALVTITEEWFSFLKEKKEEIE